MHLLIIMYRAYVQNSVQDIQKYLSIVQNQQSLSMTKETYVC